LQLNIVYILFALLNIGLAYIDSGIIKKKIVPNHFMNGAIYCTLAAIAWYFFHANIIVLLCIRQTVFSPFLNVFRGLNFFRTSIYTSFFQKNKLVQSGSFIDKVENFFVDGIINICSRRKWSWQPPVDLYVKTYNNYLNGKIQFVIYSSILIYILWQNS
jgi:hypothetical protein